MLYPPLRAVYLAFDGDAAYVALLVLHLGLGAFLSLLLARSLGLSTWPCVLVASWVILPSWLIRVGEHPIYFEAVAWIPGLLLLGRRVVLAPSAPAVGLLALAPRGGGRRRARRARRGALLALLCLPAARDPFRGPRG